jgi:hypothetical protein
MAAITHPDDSRPHWYRRQTLAVRRLGRRLGLTLQRMFRGLPALPEDARPLLTLAGLPLIDGFFLAFLGAGLWRDLGHAAAFGLTAFSGAGCVVAASQLRGSLGQRIGQVLAVYALVGAGAVIVTALQPIFQSLLPANLALFTGVFLIGLGLWISGLRRARQVASWIGFQAAVKVMLVASLIHGLLGGIDWRVSLSPEVLAPLALALGAGLTLTLGGIGLSVLRDRVADPRPLNWGAGASLLLMGLTVLGWPIPTLAVLAPLGAGCLWSVGAGFRRGAPDQPPAR